MSESSLLVLRLSALGDIIHALPAVIALRERLGRDTRFGWVVESPYRELVERVAPVDEVFGVSTKRWRRDPLGSEARKTVPETLIAVRRFTRGGAAIDFQGLIKSALIGRISGAKVRVGFESRAVREKPSILFTNRRFAVDRSQHVVDWNLQLASAAFGSQATPAPRIDLSSFLAEPPIDAAGTVVLNPGAGRNDKLWPIERFVDLARELGREHLESLVVWGPGELGLAETIAREGGARLAPPTTLRELAAVLGLASAVVAADTGPLHLAAAMGTPVVGLFGPTAPRRNGPYGQIDRCVETWNADRRMESIPVRSVLERVMEVRR